MLIPDFDLLIGSTAVENSMVMVTNNERHLNRITGIKIENWNCARTRFFLSLNSNQMKSSQELPLNDQQLEILKLFSRELDEEDMREIKKLIVRYLAQKVSRLADEAWEKNNWSDEDMERLLERHERTPYDPRN